MTEVFTNPSTIGSSTYRRPYLNFKEKVTQLVLNPYSFVLFLFIVKLLFFLNSLINTLENAKTQTLLLHSTLEGYATNLVSFPHYMALVSNVMIAKSVEAANKGLVKTLQLMISASENLIYFVIDLSIGTYACLLTAAIDDTVISALNATESIITVANETLVSFATDLNDGLQDLSTALNELVDTAEDTGDALKHLFGDKSSKKNISSVEQHVSHINLTIASMKEWEIPGSINDKIENLKGDVLNFTVVQYYTRKIIDKPFTELKRQVSSHLNQTFDADDMFVPEKTVLNFSEGTDQIHKLYSELIRIAKTTTHVIMGLVLFAMLLLILYEYYIELKDWRRVKEASKHLNYANESYINTTSKKKYNIEVIKSIQDRKSNFIGNIITQKILRLKSPVAVNNTRWVINYAASPYLLPFLLIGILGVVSVICQYIVLALISRIDITNASKHIFNSTETEVYAKFNSSMNQWTNETNLYMNDYENSVNDNLFSWVITAATTINDTVSEFDEKMNNALDSMFKGTPLYQPIEQIVGCVIESKLKKIEKAMTWLEENAKFSMPELNPKHIMNKMMEIESSNASSSLNDDAEKFKSKAKTLLHDAIRFYKSECLTLLYFSIGIILVWFLFFSIGLLILFLKERKICKSEKKSLEVNDSDKENFDSTIEIPFDGSTLRSVYSDELEEHMFSVSHMLQIFRDKYLKTREDYSRTPTEPQPQEKDGSLYDNYNTFLSQVVTEVSTDSANSLENPKSNSNFVDEKGTIEEDSKSDQDTNNDGTLSVIGENITSIEHAKRWSP